MTTSVSADDLDGPAREALQRCLEQADLGALAERSPITGPGADMFQYDIVLEHGDAFAGRGGADRGSGQPPPTRRMAGATCAIA